MVEEERKDRKPAYEPPRVLASYSREELLETVRPHGDNGYNMGCGCGCS